jgi:hypothetical protein
MFFDGPGVPPGLPFTATEQRILVNCYRFLPIRGASGLSPAFQALTFCAFHLNVGVASIAARTARHAHPDLRKVPRPRGWVCSRSGLAPLPPSDPAPIQSGRKTQPTINSPRPLGPRPFVQFSWKSLHQIPAGFRHHQHQAAGPPKASKYRSCRNMVSLPMISPISHPIASGEAVR